ncbi:MAG: hypothetical protein LBC18_03055 [Opitutaceae bacterium]|jgi:hypothetical protein|nr:hypothetical protein [Opitutaceae bacterium]
MTHDETPITTLEVEQFALVTLHVTDIPQTEKCLCQQANDEGFPGLTPAALRDVLRDMAERGLVVSQIDELGGIRRWRATAKGVSVLKEAGLIFAS